jgi:hypothetical protein
MINKYAQENFKARYENWKKINDIQTKNHKAYDRLFCVAHHTNVGSFIYLEPPDVIYESSVFRSNH